MIYFGDKPSLYEGLQTGSQIRANRNNLLVTKVRRIFGAVLAVWLVHILTASNQSPTTQGI